MPIFFHTADISFNLKKKNIFKKWIYSEIEAYKLFPGRINIILCSDNYILEINKKYLNHNYFTDIITFNYNEGNVISGDLYIGLERVKDNSEIFNSGFFDEISRVIIHGIFHLIGFDDNTDESRENMRELENKSLKRFEMFLL